MRVITLFTSRIASIVIKLRLKSSLVAGFNIPSNNNVLSSMASVDQSTKIVGLLLGAYRSHGLPKLTDSANELDTSVEKKLPKLTASAYEFDISVEKKLSTLLKRYPFSKDVKKRLFYGSMLNDTYNYVTVVELGPENAGYNDLEGLDEKKENIRKAIAGGVQQLIDAGATEIFIDPCGDDESAAESTNLITFKYDELKSESSRKTKVHIEPVGFRSLEWDTGLLKADAQNFARYLSETPANFMEPSHFVSKVTNKLKNLNVEVIARDKKWAEEKKMGSFLSVSHGSSVPPLLLELHYRGGDESQKPIVLVGKGITFDSGGISLKRPENMDKMRADMGGAAVVVSAIYAAASLKLKLNIIGITPLTENMPSGTATKPGDVVFAMNGKSIQVDNTDAEGRLVLADGLCYAQTFSPRCIIDLATLTGAVRVALGGAATAVYSNNTDLFDVLHKASVITGDRVWRMPLIEYYANMVRKSDLADLNNIAGKGLGGSCIAAAFLWEFVGNNKWMHLDIAGVSENHDDVPYLRKGMSGRPTRTLIEFLRSMEKLD